MQGVSSSAAAAAPDRLAYDAAVLQKTKSHIEEQGRQAVQLIEAATSAQLATSGSVGTKLHVVA